MLFFLLLMCSLKFNFESIVLPISVTDETDFVVMSPICNVSCIRLVNMLSKFKPQE